MFRMLLFGYLCQHRGRIVPSAAFCLSSLPEEKRDEWEMSQAGPQQLITAFCPLWSEHINQQPLLLLGVSPSGNFHVGLGWFPSPCVPDVHNRRACGGAFTGATKLVPHAGQGCSNRRFKAALWRQVSCSHSGDTCAKHPHVLARDGGKQGDLVQLVLHPSSLSHHSQTSPQTAPKNTAFPWNVFV